jgi:hypothetical protein
MDEQLAYTRRQRGSDTFTQSPEVLPPHLQKAARNEQHEEGGRVRSSKARHPTHDQNAGSKSARSREVGAAGHRDAWEKGTRQACGEGHGLGCMPGVRMERNADRQAQRDVRGFDPVKTACGQEERDPAEGASRRESTAPAAVHDFDERTRSSTNLRPGLVRPTRGSRPLASEFDGFARDEVTNRRIELIEQGMVQHGV